MYGFTKSFSITIFASIIIGVLSVGYAQTPTGYNILQGANDYLFSAHDHMLQRAIDADPSIETKIAKIGRAHV